MREGAAIMRKGLWIGLGLAVSAAVVVSLRVASQSAPISHGRVFATAVAHPNNSAPARAVHPVNLPPATADARATAVDPFASAEPPEWDQVERAISIVRSEPRRTTVPADLSPQFPQPVDPFFDPAPVAPILPGPPVVQEPVDGPADALSVDPHPLRHELMTAVARKLELMSVEQLRTSLQKELATIRELEAAIQLARAKEALETLSKSHPETEAAKAARHMLGEPTQNWAQPGTIPTVAPQFQQVRPRRTSVDPPFGSPP
jgi:hypothetical protein